ncbi:DUF2510 domain-containing protein [Mycobacterium sp. MYCO198283]|uniref:DUF2510 domain-containing protein n=1 Tax=Mycobacterium sp. MYCO198283 TaxID=2883505 RepID=UPI0035AB84F5
MGDATPPPAGWYPDPYTGQQRWFDGTNWGPFAPPQSAPPTTNSGESRFTIHYGFALLAIFALLGTVIPAMVMFSTASDPDTGGFGAVFGGCGCCGAACGPSYG